MFEELAAKLSDLGSHHQMAFTIIVTISVICMSWAIERIFDHYVFTNKPLYGYITVIIISLFLLWLTQHFILHIA